MLAFPPAQVTGRLFSASWDKTARAWDISTSACIAIFKGHEAALWSVLPIGDSEVRVITASADRTIKLWSGEKCERTYTGHADVVRDLALVGDVGCFLSCSNDSTVRMWQLDGECLRILRVSETFVYGVAVLPSGEWLTCSEDRTIRVWSGLKDECVQSIAHPATVWACAAMPNGDVIAGCADGKAYVWTRVPSRCAGLELQAAFKEEVAAVAMPAQQVEGMVGDLEVAKLATEDALAEPGNREGQHKIVKDKNGTPMLYQWSMAAASWEKIGEVTGSSDGGTLGKRSYGGKEYDYLFDIDINGTMLKLPFNRGDDPWMAAQQWLWNNDIDQGFLDQVAQFIIQNTPGNTPATVAGNVDPFTSSGAYRPGASSVPGGGGLRGNVDPFTSSGAYRPGALPAGVPTCGGSSAPADPWMRGAYTTAQGAAARAAAAIQSTASVTYANFGTAKHDAVLAKLLEFSSTLRDGEAADMALNAGEATAVTELVGALRSGALTDKVAREGLAALSGGNGRPGTLKWPSNLLFPALDVLRLLLLHIPRAPLEVLDPPLIPRLLELLAPGSATAADKAAPLMILRGLANVLANQDVRSLVVPHVGSMLDTLSNYVGSDGSVQARLAACTVLLNACSLLREPTPPPDAEALALQAVSLIAHALGSATQLTLQAEEEALYRLLCATSTVLEAGPGALEAANDLGLDAALSSLSLGTSAAAKVQQKLSDVKASLAKRSKP